MEAITHHWNDHNPGFSTAASGGFCMKGARFNKAWSKNSYSATCLPLTKADEAFSKALLKSHHTITVWTVLKSGNECDQQVHNTCANAATTYHVQMFYSFGFWNKLLFATSSGLRFASGFIHLRDHEPSPGDCSAVGFPWTVNFSPYLTIIRWRRASHTEEGRSYMLLNKLLIRVQVESLKRVSIPQEPEDNIPESL